MRELGYDFLTKILTQGPALLCHVISVFKYYINFCKPSPSFDVLQLVAGVYLLVGLINLHFTTTLPSRKNCLLISFQILQLPFLILSNILKL